MSRTALLLNCQYPFDPRLTLPEQHSGHAANYGIAFHAAICAMLRGADRPELDAIADAHGIGRNDLFDNVEDAARRVAKYLSANDFGVFWDLSKAILEQSFALDPVLAVARPIALPDAETHSYNEKRDGEMCGTVDLACMSADGVLLVWDHKTGAQADLDSARQQLYSLALTLGLIHNPKRVILVVMHAPRDGVITIHDEEIKNPIQAMGIHRAKLAEAMAKIGDGSLRPGEWCQYCPARPVCPARDADIIVESHALVPALMSTANTLMRREGEELALSPAENLGRVHQLCSLYDKLRERLQEKMKEECTRLGYGVRPDGKVLFLKPRKRETVSKASIERALGKKRADKELERLRAKGCVETTEFQELRAEYEK